MVRVNPHKFPTRKKIHEKIDDLDNVDFISSNVYSSRKEALLYIFEDNESVIEMIIKGGSPTMRHVSTTRRVSHDWLFDRINVDPKIQIKYIDTKNQLADILTKGNFARDEWNHLLCLFNISHFSSINSRHRVRYPNETKSESQNVPLSSLNVQQTRTGRPVMDASSSNCSEWNIDEKWSSQE